MTQEELSFKLSCDLSRLVSRRYFIDRYGISTCNDAMEGGDLYDLYIKKLFVDSDYDCDDIFHVDD